jgi:succinyl-diaminopimelate desuccinylase
MPHLGRNAIYPLARALGALEELRFDVPAHDVLGEPTLNLGTLSGGLNINSVPDRATAGIDVRTVPGLDGDAVRRAVADALGSEVRVETELALDAIDTDAADPWVEQVFGVMETLIDERPEPRGLAYFTDAAALTPAYGRPPTIICGPGDAEQAHRTDESCSVARIEAAAEGFFEIARAWCRG